MTRFRFAAALMVSGIALVSSEAFAQSLSFPGSVPSPADVVSAQQGPAQGAQDAVKGTVKRFNIGVEGGVAIHPELLVGGVYAELGPVFSEKVTIRPDFYVAGGEVTTELGFDVDGLFALPWSAGDNWRTYAGVGASFALSHESFEEPVDDDSPTTTTSTSSNGTTTTTQDRFDFSDTDFEVGANLIFGMRNARGVFFEVRGTAWGVSNVKLLAGFKF